MPDPPAQDPISRRSAAAVLLALLALYSVLTVRQMATVGLTVDEPTYFNSGRIILNTGWEHPITHLHGPIPYYFNQLLVGTFPAGGFERAADPAGLVFRGRLGMLGFGWLAGLVVYLWSARVFGRAGGLLSAALFALNPLMIAYGGLLATDMAHTAAVLLCLYLTWRAVVQPGWARALVAGAGLGLAFATKYLALLVGPLVVPLIALAAFRERTRPGGVAAGRKPAEALRALGLAAAVTAAALVTLHACYGFRAGFATLDPGAYRSALIAELVQLPGAGRLLASFPAPYLLGVDYQMSVGEGEHYMPYLNGRFAPRHFGYYLWSFLLKTPEWVIALVLWLCLFRLPRWLAGRGTQAERTTAWVLFPPMAVVACYLSFLTGLQIGIRYVLPLYPMLFVLLGAVATTAWMRRLGPRGWALCGAALLGLQGLELARSWPNLLGYFNAAAGGQARAYLHFNDSNSDWGQLVVPGLRELEETEREHFAVLTVFDGPRFGRLAIKLRDLVTPDPEDPGRLRHWLLAFEPVRHVGAAWWVFEVTPEAFEAAVARSGDERLRADLCVAYVGAGRVADARPHLERLPAQRAGPLAELARLAEAAEDAAAPVPLLLEALAAWEAVGRFDRVEALLCDPRHAALEQHPAYAHLLGRALAKQGRIGEAIAVLEAGEDLARSGGAVLLAELYVESMRHRDALALLARTAEGEGPLADHARQRLSTLRVETENRERYFEALR